MKTVLFVLLLAPVFAWAQIITITPEDTQRKHSYLLMRDGSVVRGQIVRQDSSLITVRVKGGELSFVEADQVIRISPNRPNDIIRTDGQSNAPGQNTVFVLKDGSQVAGKFVRRDSTMITVRKQNGQLTYFEPELLGRVDTVRTSPEPSNLPASADGPYTNRFSPWLLTGQTAYNPEKGRFYYRNTFIVLTQFETSFAQLNEFDYGITRNWSVGMSLQPQINDSKVYGSSDRHYLAVDTKFFSKVSFPIGEQFRLSVNASYQPSQSRDYYTISQQIVLQGLMSFGDGQRNATLGYGMRIYPDYTTTNKKTSFISAGVMHKIARSLTIISDNTFYLNPFYGGNSAELSVALRLNHRRHAFDVGALAAVQINPIIDYGFGVYNPHTRAYFSPYIAYNLLIGRN